MLRKSVSRNCCSRGNVLVSGTEQAFSVSVAVSTGGLSSSSLAAASELSGSAGGESSHCSGCAADSS